MRISNAKCMPLRRYAIRRACGCGVVVYAPIASTPKRLEAAASKLTHEEAETCGLQHLGARTPLPLPAEHHGQRGNRPISDVLAEAVLHWREKRRGAA